MAGGQEFAKNIMMRCIRLACVVAIWLICNEIISILENINDIGVTLPPFLQPIVKNLKSQVEKKADIEEREDK